MVQWRFLLYLFLVSVRDLAKFSVVLKLVDLLDSFELSGIYIYSRETVKIVCGSLCERLLLISVLENCAFRRRVLRADCTVGTTLYAGGPAWSAHPC